MTTTYSVPDTDLVLDASKRTVYKIRDLPHDQKPREKLVAHGPSALSTQELVAVLLTVGTKKEEVMEMATRVVREYGERSLASQRDVSALVNDLHLPLAKAAQLVSAMELGRRFFNTNIHGIAVIRTPKDVFDYVKDMRRLPKEHLRGLYLNTHHRIIHDEVISIGTINSNVIHPREVFKPALEYAAAAVVLVHNHPSGIVTPSDEDVTITEQLIEAGKIIGITLLDHVVVTRDDFISIPVSYDT